MYNHSSIVTKKIVEVYNKGFQSIKQLVDVGGGRGVTNKTIISTYPRTRGINFDLPHVLKHAPFLSRNMNLCLIIFSFELIA